MPAHGGSGQWPEPGKWLAVKGKLIPCENGLHLCRPLDIAFWYTDDRHVLSAVDIAARTQRIDQDNKVVVRKARLVGEPLSTWTPRTARLFACDCAEHVLPIYERRAGDATVLRTSIAVARRFAIGEATRDELAAAWDAAGAAAWAAAGDAAWDAARDAARAAAWAAAGDAAWDAAGAAARAAERAWQTAQILWYLNGEPT
jgi:hypothetical protein